MFESLVKLNSCQTLNNWQIHHYQAALNCANLYHMTNVVAKGLPHSAKSFSWNYYWLHPVCYEFFWQVDCVQET